jgi:hypothetical protein
MDIWNEQRFASKLSEEKISDSDLLQLLSGE